MYKRSPIRSLIFLLHLHYDMLLYYVYYTRWYKFNNLLMFNNYYNYEDDELDMEVNQNYFAVNWTIPDETTI